MCFSRKKLTGKFIVNDGAACGRFYIVLASGRQSKGTLADKKCQQTPVNDISCNTAEYTRLSYF